MVLYLAVSKDRYELPVAVAESSRELGQMVGVSRNAILSHISHAKSGAIKQQTYFRVETDDEEDENASASTAHWDSSGKR